MGPGRTEKISPYDRADVIRTLNEVAAHDWEDFIHERVDVPQETLPLSVVERCGYRLQYAANPSERLEYYEEDGKFVYVADSIGLVFDQEGKILNVIPGMAGDNAGLAPGMKAEGVMRLQRLFAKGH